MILYADSLERFRDDVDANRIDETIHQAFFAKLGYHSSDSERNAWRNSLRYMESATRRAELPNDCGILIEYRLPAMSKRIDFLITGRDDQEQDNFVIVELKQWQKAEATEIAEKVRTFLGGQERDVVHPAYQAASYLQHLTLMNEAIQEQAIVGYACAYLHNFVRREPEPLCDEARYPGILSAPLFFNQDTALLQEFLKRYLCHGCGLSTMYQIENSRIRPSRKLIDCVDQLYHGHEAFVLMDDQKVAYETILHHARSTAGKLCIIVYGGPGTGKSVLSMNLLGQLIKDRFNVRFVAPNAAFRKVMLETLIKKNPKERSKMSLLFSGSSGFHDAPGELFDILIIDEAHRLKDHTAYQYRGKNQVADMVRSARISIFFLDESQQIRMQDIGSRSSILEQAQLARAGVVELQLSTQFRCSGAEGYINWLTDVLQIEKTGNQTGWDQNQFEFRLFDDPNEIRDLIQEKADNGYQARILAGYAWPWSKDTLAQVDDVAIPEHNFAMPWNQRKDSELWAIRPEGMNQVGCIHTAQGLEFDYVGVLIGNDLRCEPDTDRLYADPQEYQDISGKRGTKSRPEELDRLIKNIYKVLCSRGMKGCYVYCRDAGLREYLQRRVCIAEGGVVYEVGESMGMRVADEN